MHKVITIVGARPQFVKAAVVSRAIKKLGGIEEIIVHTGQHFDKGMSDVFFEEMQIPKPKYNLEVNGLSHGAMTGKMLEKLEELFIQEKPDLVLVYGDTNSTLAGALAATKIHIPIAHVEAGLRSFNMKMPEEINRILTDRISDILFPPTATAVKNLKNEGFEHGHSHILNVGDVMNDAALYYSKLVDQKNIKPKNQNKDFYLCTVHRADNTDNPHRLSSIVNALNKLHEEIEVVLPLHPRTKQKIADFGLSLNVNTIAPVGYFEMIQLLKHTKLVLTDSGGLQKEAYFFKKPCVTMRDQTEWTELVEHGYNILVGSNQGKIIAAVEELSAKELKFDDELYGDGRAGEKIVESIKKYFNE
jgi:UDP-GlcNAc3NAcA epimerase